MRRLIFLAMCITILFVQEQLMTIVPNVQFSTLLIMLFATLFTFKENFIIIFVHVLLDNLYMGSFNPLYTPAMFIAWMLIPIAWHTVLRKTTSETKLALFGFVFGFIYGWVFIPFRMIEFGITEFWPYLLADLPYEVIMAVSNFVTILWLFGPLRKTLLPEIESINEEKGYTRRHP